MTLYSLDYLLNSSAWTGPVKSSGFDLEQTEMLDRVKLALTHLSDGERQAFLAWAKLHPDGLSCRKLAHQIGISPTAVTKRAKAARRKLFIDLENLQ